MFAYALIIFRAVKISELRIFFDGKGAGRSQIRGDAFTEYLSHNGVEYFFDHGFWNTKLLPHYEYHGATAQNKVVKVEAHQVYTHYPSLPDAWTGFTAKIFGTTDTRVLRIIPIVFSVIWLLFMCKALRLIHTSPAEFVISFCAIILSNYFVAWADNMHKFMYEEIFKWAIIFYFLKQFIVQPKKSNIFVLFLLFFLLANISLDSIVVAAFLAVGFSLAYKKKIFCVETIAPGIATLAGFALHFYQNSLFFGSAAAAWNDLMSIASVRTVGGAGAGEMGSVSLLGWLAHFFYWNPNRVERYFLIPGWAFLIMSYFVLREWRKDHDARIKLFWIFLAASSAWNLVMWQHSMVHVWVARNWAFFAALMSGPIVCFIWQRWQVFSSLNVYAKCGLVAISIYIAGMALTQHVWDMYLRYGFLYPHFGF